jgi:hypothetical protein
MPINTAYPHVKRAKRLALSSLALTTLALGSIVQSSAASFVVKHTNNFETNMDGFEISRPTLSGSSDPLRDRIMIVADPDGAGKSVRFKMLSGDTGDKFKTSATTEPRVWITNHSAFTFKKDSTVRYTWKMWTPGGGLSATNANIAQVISDGTPFGEVDRPLWMLKTDANREISVSIHYSNTKNGEKKIGYTMPTNKWVKFEVTFNFRQGNTGSLIVKISEPGTTGTLTYSITDLGFEEAYAKRTCHWDGGIYNRERNVMTTDRILYFDDFKVENYQ